MVQKLQTQKMANNKNEKKNWSQTIRKPWRNKTNRMQSKNKESCKKGARSKKPVKQNPSQTLQKMDHNRISDRILKFDRHRYIRHQYRNT